jgi:hypothetical protein
MSLPTVFRPKANGFRLSPHVWLDDVECPCCGFARIHPELVGIYEQLYRRYGPFSFNSWARCQAKDDSLYVNKPNAKRYPVSGHVKGTAVDIDVRLPDDGEAESYYEEIGISRVGYGRTFTHVETDREGFRTYNY